MNTKELCFALLILVPCPGSALADTNTIWSYYPLGGQTERHEIITSCNMSLCFYDPSTGIFSPEILNETVAPANQGQTYTATAATDPNFSDFVSRILATDNSSDLVAVRMITNNGTDLSTGTEKSVVFAGAPNFNNFKIDSILLTLNDFELDTPGGDLWHDGKDTYFSEALTLTVAPEPNSMVLLIIASISTGIYALRRK